MSLRYLRRTLTVVMLTLFATQSSRAQSLDLGPKGLKNDQTCFSDFELAALSAYKTDCDLTRMNLESTKTTLSAIQAVPDDVKWYQEPGVVIAGVSVTFSVGLILGVMFVK